MRSIISTILTTFIAVIIPFQDLHAQSLNDFEREDRDLQYKVREEITKDRTLSVEARNVDVTSKDGRITLKGVVKSIDEQSRIERIARNQMGVTSVINQTEIKEGEENETR